MYALHELLEQANKEEKTSLAKIVSASGSRNDQICEALQRQATSAFGFHVLNKRPGYEAIVSNMAKRVTVNTKPSDPILLEKRITQQIWRTVWDRMTPQQRLDFDRELQKQANQWCGGGRPAGILLTGAGLLSAQLSGFGVYMLASSTLGALTAGLGIALPFGAYTAMSSAIAVIIGPAGWIGLGLFALHKLTGPNHQRVLSAIIMVHCIRARIDAERKLPPAPMKESSTTWIVVLGVGIVVLWFLLNLSALASR